MASLPIQNVLILGGQSNMAGADALVDPASGIRDLAEMGMQTNADRRTLFTFAARLDPAHPHSCPWGDIRGHGGPADGRPTNADGAIFKVIGPEVGIARALAKHGWQNVAMIKASTNFQQLENGRSPWVRPNSHWKKWSEFIHTQLGELSRKAEQIVIRGFLWHQGIDDGLLGQSRAAYEADLRQLIDDLRAEFATVSTPFVLARSVNSPIAGREKMAPIREAQIAVAENVHQVAWVDADDLQPYVRQHHLRAEAQLIIGQRMGEALVRLTCEGRD